MMRPDNLQVIGQILSPLRRSQSKTITLVIEGMAWMAQAASIPVAAFVSQATGSQINSALTRFYRLLHNPKLDDLKVTRQMLSFFAQLPGPFLIAIDWTEWHPPFRMLLASVVRGTRAIPVHAAVLSKTHILRSQNTWENNFLRLLCWLLNEIKVSACFVSDRGFQQVSYLKLLQEQKEHSFLVRITDQITVEFRKRKRLLKKCGLQPGHALTWESFCSDRMERFVPASLASGPKVNGNPGGSPPTYKIPSLTWRPSMTVAWPSRNKSVIPRVLALA
jgi:hypothetical protein